IKSFLLSNIAGCEGARLIARYTRPEMGHIWSDENKFRTWLEVEVAATETLAEAGIVPQAAAKAIRERGGFDLARINQIEAEVKHDVIAFTTAVAEKVGPESRPSLSTSSSMKTGSLEPARRRP